MDTFLWIPPTGFFVNASDEAEGAIENLRQIRLGSLAEMMDTDALSRSPSKASRSPSGISGRSLTMTAMAIRATMEIQEAGGGDGGDRPLLQPQGGGRSPVGWVSRRRRPTSGSHDGSGFSPPTSVDVAGDAAASGGNAPHSPPETRTLVDISSSSPRRSDHGSRRASGSGTGPNRLAPGLVALVWQPQIARMLVKVPSELSRGPVARGLRQDGAAAAKGGSAGNSGSGTPTQRGRLNLEHASAPLAFLRSPPKSPLGFMNIMAKLKGSGGNIAGDSGSGSPMASGGLVVGSRQPSAVGVFTLDIAEEEGGMSAARSGAAATPRGAPGDAESPLYRHKGLP